MTIVLPTSNAILATTLSAHFSLHKAAPPDATQPDTTSLEVEPPDGYHTQTAPAGKNFTPPEPGTSNFFLFTGFANLLLIPLTTEEKRKQSVGESSSEYSNFHQQPWHDPHHQDHHCSPQPGANTRAAHQIKVYTTQTSSISNSPPHQDSQTRPPPQAPQASPPAAPLLQ